MESLLRLVSAMGYTADTWETASSVAAVKSIFAILFEGESRDEDRGAADALHVSGRFDRVSTVGDLLSAVRHIISAGYFGDVVLMQKTCRFERCMRRSCVSGRHPWTS